jgi:hypothetical protein
MDDSKDSQQAKMLVCAGWIGERSDWLDFCQRWNKYLIGNQEIQYYKTSEYKMLMGEFKKFRQFPKPDGRNAAKKVRDTLLEIIKSYDNLRSVGVCIPMDEWNNVSNRPEAKGVLEFPYRRAIESVWVETVKRGFRRSREHRHSVCLFIHDDGPDYPKLAELYTAFKNLNSRTAKHMAGFSGLDDKLNPPLQAADLIASHTLEIGMDWLDNGKTSAKESELQSSMGFLSVWREKYAMGVLRHELKRRGLPLPDQLERDYEECMKNDPI